MTDSNPARFALDEDKARAWLAALDPDYDGPEVGVSGDAPEIGAGYRPQDDWESGSQTWALVEAAQDDGIIGAGPGRVAYDYHHDYDGDHGYEWHIYMPGGGLMKLATLRDDLRHLGDRTLHGAEAALAVLREAVRDGNLLLDGLDAYVAARAPRSVYVLEWSDDKYGSSLEAYATEEQAHAAKVAVARNNWGRVSDNRDPDSLSDEEVLDLYLERGEAIGEILHVHDLDVEQPRGDAAPCDLCSAPRVAPGTECPQCRHRQFDPTA